MDVVTPGISLFIISSLFFIFMIGLFIYCMVDVMRNDFRDNDKLIWVLITVFVPALGMFLHLLIGIKISCDQSKNQVAYGSLR